MTEAQLADAVEAMLLGSGEPITMDRLRRAVMDADTEESESEDLLKRIRQVIEDLKQATNKRPFELRETAVGFRYVTRAEYAPFISSLKGQQPPTYSRATLETLAVIAWKQPVTRGEIEQIRGVRLNSSILRALADRDWIRVTGHRESPGRPALYATTRSFLDYFGLKSLDELPSADDLVTDAVQEGLLEKRVAARGEEAVAEPA